MTRLQPDTERGNSFRSQQASQWKLVLKSAVALVLLTVIFLQVDFSQLRDTLSQARLDLIAVVTILMMLSITISAYKWQQLLMVHNLPYGFWILQRWYFIAAFFNNFLPTSIGGDAYRVLKTLNNERGRACAFIAITMERVSGLIILVAMAYLAATFIWLTEENELARLLVLYLTIGGGLSLLAVVILACTGWIPRLIGHPKCPAALRSVWSHLSDFKSHPGRSAWATIGMSVIFHVHTLVYYWILLLAVGEAVSPQFLLVILAATAAASMLPISINGIGVIEGTFVYMSVQFGIGFEAALAAILIVRAIRLIQSGVGAIFYFRGDRQQSKLAAT